MFKAKKIPFKFFSKKRKTPFVLIIALGLCLVMGWVIQGVYFPVEKTSKKIETVIIEKGESLKEIASKLQNKGVIKSKFFFELYALLSNSAKNLQAGIYEISSSMNIPQIISKLSAGEVAKEKIVIVEGWNLKDIAQALEKKGGLRAEEFLEKTGYLKPPEPSLISELEKKFDFLKEKPKDIGLEGYLFPDTYEIKKGEEVGKVIEKMLKNFEKKITPELKKEIKKQGKTLFQIITMASLLEREAKSYEDKQKIAGILWKRLKNGWKLQVDATLTYILGKPSLLLTKEDLQIDSPYNTYKYYGLPKGPICNPGIESIKAAIYYKETPFWFYLNTKDGRTLFSKTLKEHNFKRWKYLR